MAGDLHERSLQAGRRHTCCPRAHPNHNTQGLASADVSTAPRLGSLIEGPLGKQVQQCTRRCVPTCIRGGQGAPGLGPMSLRCVWGG